MRGFGLFHPEQLLHAVPDETRRRVIAAADEILAGRWELLGSLRRDMEDPDWFFDPVTGRRAPQLDYCFKVNHRSEDVTGNVKQIWELSRHAPRDGARGCLRLSGDERYAERAASHLRSWWAQNPFLSGVHWTSGIEAGLRLITWVWVRRLLDRLGRSSRPLRAQRDGPCPNLVAPALPRILPEPGVVRQQSRHRRGRRPPGGGARL